MPDDVLDWEGNQVESFVAKAVLVRLDYASTYNPTAPSVQSGINSRTITNSTAAIREIGGIYACTKQIDFSNFTKVKIDVTSSSYGSSQMYNNVSMRLVEQITESSNTGIYSQVTIASTGNLQPPYPIANTGIIEIDVSNITQSGYVVLETFRNPPTAGDSQPSVTYSRIWLE